MMQSKSVKKIKIGEYDKDLSKLFDQFKFHLIYQNKKHTPIKPSNTAELKNIYSQLSQDNASKRNTKQRLIQQLSTIHCENQTKSRPQTSSSLLSRKNQERIKLSELLAIEEQALIKDIEKQQLLSEIDELQKCFKQLKKGLVTIRNDLNQENTKVEKFKHISYLTKSIDQQTETTKIINTRAFHKLYTAQDSSLNHLKKFKTILRKENQELENQYVHTAQQKSEKSAIKPDHQKPSSNSIFNEAHGLVIFESFLEKLSELHEMLFREQGKFEELKQSQSSRVLLKKVKKEYLKQERKRLHGLIDDFQRKYEMKLQSFPSLISFIYKNLLNLNEDLEKECIKINIYRQNLFQELIQLQAKAKSSTFQTNTTIFIPNTQSHKTQNFHSHTTIFLKIIMLFHSLLSKFRHMFTITLTLNMEKKNFQQFLIQIEELVKNDSLFYQKIMKQSTKNLPVDHDTTNKNELIEMCKFYHEQIAVSDIQEIISILFNDNRNIMILKKSNLEEELQDEINDKMELLQKINKIRTNCEEIYDEKLKSYYTLFLNCMRTLSMNKYQKKLISSSNTRNSLFLSIINKQFSPEARSLHSEDQIQQNSILNSVEETQKITKQQHYSYKEKTKQMKLGHDPRKVIQVLQKIKNQEKNHFKPVKFDEKQVYLYDYSVVLPKYVI